MSSLYSAVQEALSGPVRQPDPDHFEADFLFRDDFTGFFGHFPEKPVLPGIAQIMAVQVAVRADPHLLLARIKRCKFFRPVLPGERLSILAERRKQEDGNCLVTANLSVDEEPCASITLSFSSAGCQETE